MILTIDNLDGLGPLDYTHTIDPSEPFTIDRTLNAPSTLKGVLCLIASTLRTPIRRARIVVTTDNGTTLFTGYLTLEPLPLYAGEATEGPVYRLALTAVSDEWLLDKQSFSSIGDALATPAGTLLATLATRLDPALLTTSTLPATGRAVGVFAPSATKPWSQHAGQIAASTYTAYRALAGTLALTQIPAVQHTLADGDGTLTLANLKTSSLRELANDVTVSGAEEPATYYTELFTGDGTTAAFSLAGEPESPNAAHATLLAEPFNEPVLNPQQWQIADPGAHLTLSANGLTFTGGTGLDGQTTLTAWDPVELGGTLILELAGLTLAAASAGLLGGLYTGAPLQANCFAGFNIRQSGGATLATPLINGVEAGTSLTILPGHQYTLRIHLHAPELLRIQQAYYALDDTGASAAVTQFGGGTTGSPISLVFEARDLASSSNTPVTLLCDTTLATSPAQATVVAINSLALSGSLASFNLTRTGTCWIRSTPTSGAPFTRLAGKATDGVDCAVTSSAEGKVTFFPGRIPAAGESVAISYRGRQRAVARLADPASIALETAGGSIGTARWLGHVVTPPARSQQDCESAAQAILSFAANRAAALSGTYEAINPPTTDLWPGDVLTLTTNGSTVNAILRKVTVSQQGASPERLTYRIAFANDWAEGLSLHLTETLPANTPLPDAALSLTAGTLPPHTLANLNQLTLTPTTSSLTLDAGFTPPSGGGFEVRRRNGGFGIGTASLSGDLVLRSPSRTFTIPLATAPETFYLRMYDASIPPLYSRYSTAILNN